jgi:hypothetical protein
MLSLRYLARWPFSKATETIPSTVVCARGTRNPDFGPSNFPNLGYANPDTSSFIVHMGNFSVFFIRLSGTVPATCEVHHIRSGGGLTELVDMVPGQILAPL